MENNAATTKTFNDIKAANEIVWLGVDFSHVKLIGPSGFNDVYSIINIQFAAINDLFVREPDKFSFYKFLGKIAQYRLEKVFERNMKVSTDGLIVMFDTPDRFNKDSVQQIVNDYQFAKEDKIGLLFVTESLDKNQSCCFAWVTFIDLNTGAVIHTVKYSGGAIGFGFRNYWANSFHNILKRLPALFR